MESGGGIGTWVRCLFDFLRYNIAGSRFKSRRHRLELRQCRGQIFDDFPGDHLGRRQVVRIFQRLIAQPGDIEVDLVAGENVVIGVCLPPLGFNPLVAGLSDGSMTSTMAWMRSRGVKYWPRQNFCQRHPSPGVARRHCL